MSITFPPELLPSPDEGQGADVWVMCVCGCTWDPTILAACPVCDPKEITDSKDAEISKLKSQLEEARAKAIEDAAQVAAISASASEDHGDDDGAFMAREIETGIRALPCSRQP